MNSAHRTTRQKNLLQHGAPKHQSWAILGKLKSILLKSKKKGQIINAKHLDGEEHLHPTTLPRNLSLSALCSRAREESVAQQL